MSGCPVPQRMLKSRLRFPFNWHLSHNCKENEHKKLRDCCEHLVPLQNDKIFQEAAAYAHLNMDSVFRVALGFPFYSRGLLFFSLACVSASFTTPSLLHTARSVSGVAARSVGHALCRVPSCHLLRKEAEPQRLQPILHHLEWMISIFSHSYHAILLQSLLVMINMAFFVFLGTGPGDCCVLHNGGSLLSLHSISVFQKGIHFWKKVSAKPSSTYGIQYLCNLSLILIQSQHL